MKQGLVLKITLKNKVILISFVALLIYLVVGNSLPKALVGSSLGTFLLWPDKIIDLIKNVSLSTIASCIFYFFIVFIPELKQKESLEKLIKSKVSLIYNQSTGIAWELVATHQLRGAGTPIEMGEGFIKEWCLKTDVTLQQHSQVPMLMYEHWQVARKTSKELSDILTRNMAIADYSLLEHLQGIETTNFDILVKTRAHPQALEVAEPRITDLFEKAESLRKYYESTGKTLEDL
ncbi:hypothetical protein EYS14_04925 [Alteromonadaceae bacterium M269]|nr:hypothetical protein EYS14_04925 [Alteromonadaceae bacterium M269]